MSGGMESMAEDRASSKQVGGSHYRDFAIQPAEFIHRNGIGFLAANVIKYVCRYKAKNGRQDLEKARHYIDLLLEFEYPTAAEDVALMDEMNGLKTYGNGVDD
jgi:hypothetical protein